MKKIFKFLLISIFVFIMGFIKVNAAPDEDVAEIDGARYKSLSAAISNASTTGQSTILLLKDTTATVTIASEYNIILDLQGHTLSNSKTDKSVISNDGVLEVKNGTILSDAKAGVINNNQGATLTISSGTIKAVGLRQGLYNDGGTMYISGGASIESSSNERATIQNLNNGKLYITSGTVTSTGLYAIYNAKGTVDIGSKNDIFDKTSPVIQGKTYGVVANSSFNFYDGTIKGETYHIGKTTGTNNTPSVSDDIGETKINAIEDESVKDVFDEVVGTTTYKTITYNLDNTNRITISFDANGGSVNPTYKKIYIGDEIGTLPIPTRIDHSFDGWFTDAISGVQVTGNEKPSIDTTYYAHWTYSDPNTVAYVEGVGYKSLKDAFALGGNIRLEKDVIITESLVMSKAANLNLNGHTITLDSKKITINNDVTITDSSADNSGKITSNDDFAVVVSANGKLTHQGGTIEGLGKYGAIRNYGTLIIDGGTAIGTATERGFVVHNDNNLIIESGTIHSTNGRAVSLVAGSTLTMNGGHLSTDATNDQTLQLSSDCSAVINGGTIEGLNNNTAAIAMFQNTNLTVNGGTIKGTAMGIAGNGNENSGNANITINGGDIIALNGVGMYLPQRNSVTVINGGNISGPTGIEIRASKLIVNDGTIIGTDDNYEVTYNASGTTTKGAAIAVSQHTTKLPIEVVINGGNLKAVVPLTETNPMNNPQSAIDLISILINQGNFESTGTTTINTDDQIQVLSFVTGGTYTSDPTSYVADGYAAVKLAENKYEVTKIHNVAIDPDSISLITIEKDKYAFKDIVNVVFNSNDPGNKVIKVKDENGNLVEVNNGKFIMPDSDVLVKLVEQKLANPNTADNINLSVITLLVGVSGFIVSLKKYKKIYAK